MSTVGISFGSPTGGAGFNVSSTVSQIVANLQNVETPWKSQLTSLEAQDTSISSLGTLFSNLSNDMSSLTDLEGILAQKTGSSSDTNALTLTAADSTAVAGTHTVEVANLASTSSGYLAEMSSSTATISGSVTLQVGSGTAHTIAVTSADNTLSGLAAAINASAAGITASVLTDSSGSRLSLVSGTSGALGNITVSANSIKGVGQVLAYSGSAGTASAASTGTLAGIANASDTLSGSISIQVGSGAAQTVTVAPSSNTLSTLAAAINNTANIGVTASVVTSNGVSSLSLLSNTAGAAGTLAVTSSVVDTGSSTLGYTSTVTGADANLTVDGISLKSASNTVANLIPGVTFQLLAPSAAESDGSLEQIQVVIGNDNTTAESTVNQFVSDYNALVSAMNTQNGDTSSGTPEPLFGSPTLSLLQQQLLGGLNTQNANGSLDSIPADAGTTVSGSISIAAGGGITQKFVVGSGTNDPATNTYYTGSGSGYNTLSGLAAAINAANSSSPVTYTDAGTTSTTAPDSGTLSASSSSSLSGSVSIQVGSGTTENIVFGTQPTTGAAANTLYTATSAMTLSGLATFIQSANIGVTAAAVTTNGTTALTLTSATNGTAGALTVDSGILAAGLGVTASVATTGTESSLAFASQAAGSAGALSISSSIVASSDAVMTYTGTAGTSGTNATGTISGIPSASDTLSGSLTLQAGTGAATQFNLSSLTDKTLTGLSNAINNANIGITASIVTANGVSSLSLVSQTAGTAGNITAVSTLLDTTNPKSTTLGYTNSSDINGLTGLGISVNNDGSISVNASTLDSLLNSDYSGVVGFFQDANSWGQNFSTMLTNSGTTAGTGILALASGSNSSIESTLNADISRESALISSQQTSLTLELNSANEILQELPAQLAGVNELYSAVTGYNQNG